eukprot:scaffold316911_cov19-Tisochrysis_lutea.AAC.1
MGSLAHAVVVAGGWCRISTNFATPSHMLDRLVNYKQVLMDEQRNVSTLTTGRLAFNLVDQKCWGLLLRLCNSKCGLCICPLRSASVVQHLL